MFESLSPPYDVILADPPWKFASNSKAKPGRNAMRHYPCMTPTQIGAMPVRDIAAKASLLYLWVTIPNLPAGLDVMRWWGFRYVSSGCWAKERIGTGYWFRNRHEIVLLGKRGSFPCPKPCPHPDSIITGQQREHSRKPDQLQREIDAAYPEARKLELFARAARPGWDLWGDETTKFEE